jgi:hypothetical protein
MDILFLFYVKYFLHDWLNPCLGSAVKCQKIYCFCIGRDQKVTYVITKEEDIHRKILLLFVLTKELRLYILYVM